MEHLGRCGVHVETDAALVCARCGAFACAACAPSPTLLCGACQTRRPLRVEAWSEIPRPFGRLYRWGTSVLFLYGLFAALVLTYRTFDGMLSFLAVLGGGLVVILAGGARIASALTGRTGRAVLRRGLRLMREQRNREAAVLFEEAARFERLDRGARALALWLFGACASSVGYPERALSVLEPLTASAWRDYRYMRLLRGPGQVVLAVTRALAGDDRGAREARAAYRPTLVHRFTYAPFYGDALIALRRGEAGDEVRDLLDRSYRQGARVDDEALARATALLDGFYRELRGEDPEAIEKALAPARLSPLESPLGLARRWPALHDFVRRRLAPAG